MEIANSRMVQMTDFRGYLHRPAKTKHRQAVLIQVDQIDAAARHTVSEYPHQTLLIVDNQASMASASAYLLGLSEVDEVHTVCAKNDCSAVSGSIRDPR